MRLESHVEKMEKPILIKSFSRVAILSWLVVTLGALFYCYEYLLRISPSVMTQELMRYYHLTGAQFGNLSGSFYYYSYVIMQIMVGLLMDRYGPRRLLTLACLTCALGAYLFACSQNLIIAMVGRFLIGFGSAFAFVGAAKLATIWLPPQRFALVSGIIFCLGMLGAMFGDIVMRVLVDSAGWQVTIYGAALIGVALTFIIWSVVRDRNPFQEDHHSHYTPSIQSVIYGLGQALKNPQIWLCGIVGCLLYLFLTAFAELWGPAYLEQAHHLARTQAANANSMVFLGCAMGAPIWGWFSDLIERRRIPIILGGSLALVTISILMFVNTLSVTWIYALLFLFGFFSSVQILIFAIGRELTSIRISGTTIGLLNMLVMMGGIVFPHAIGKLLDLYWNGEMLNGARIYSHHAYTIALSVLPIGIILGILSTLFIKETFCKIYME